VGKPMTLPKVALNGNVDVAEQEGQKVNSALATIKMRVVDAISNRKSAKEAVDDTGSVLEDMAPIEDDEDGIAIKPAASEKKTSVKIKKRVYLDGKQLSDGKDDAEITQDGLEPIVAPNNPAARSTDSGTVTGADVGKSGREPVVPAKGSSP